MERVLTQQIKRILCRDVSNARKENPNLRLYLNVSEFAEVKLFPPSCSAFSDVD